MPPMPSSILNPCFILVILVLLFSPTTNATRPSFLSSRPHSDRSMIYLHSTTINTLKEKDILANTPDAQQQIQYLVHVSTVNSEYTSGITSQIEAWGGKVQYLNIEKRSYIPHDTYLITCDLHCATDLYAFPGVTWVGPFTPAMKIAPFFNRKATRNTQLPVRPHDSFELRVIAVISPLAARRRDASGVAGMVRRWNSEVSDKFDSKFGRRNSVGEHGRLVDMFPLYEDKIHVTIHHTDDGAAVVDEVVKWIAEQPESHWIEPKLRPKGNNMNARPNIQSGSTDTTEAWAWDHGLKGSGEVVGIADSGLNTQHCFFYDAANPTVSINTTNFNHRKVVAYFALQDSTDEQDGHGTHTSGSIAGTPSNSSSPLRSYSGEAPDAKLAFVDIKYGDNLDDIFDIPDNLNDVYGLTYNATARVHSDSWGTPDYPYYSDTAYQLDDFHYRHLDFLNVRSVGNDGNDGYSTMNAECASKNTLCIGSSVSAAASFVAMPNYTDYAFIIAELNYELCVSDRVAQEFNLTCDANNSTQLNYTSCCTIKNFNYACCREFIQNITTEKQSEFVIDDVVAFSSRGPTVDSRIKPDVVGPGAYIFSSRSLMTEGPDYCNSDSWVDNPDQSAITVFSGTSQTTALLAGATALVRQYYREGYWKNGVQDLSSGFAPSGALMKATMINSAVFLNHTVYDVQNFEPSFNITDDYTYSSEATYSEGFGRVQLNNVMWFGDSDFNFFTSSNSTQDVNISTGEYHSYCFKADTSKLFKATLVWTDPPASPASFFSLVNDLDLIVEDDSSLYYGNELYGANGYEAPDQVNNVEQVTVRKINGTIIVFVFGYAVVSGPQPYSLTVSGMFERVACPECSYDPDDVTEQDCTVHHGIGTQQCTPSGLFGKCKVSECDSGYVTGSLLNRDGCSAIVSLTIYSAAIMAGIAAISIVVFLCMCSKVAKRRWHDAPQKVQDEPTEKRSNWINILMIAKLAQPEAMLIVCGTILALVVVGLSLVVPLVSADIFDVLYSTDTRGDRRNKINQSIAILAGVTVGIVFFELGQGIVLALAGHRLVARLRIALFHNILQQEMAFFDQRSTGEVMSRLATDVGFLRNILSQSLPTIVSNTAQFCGGLAMMFIISWRLSLVVIAPVPVMTIAFKYYGEYINNVSVVMQDALADAASAAAETLFNIRTVRWLSGETREVNRFSSLIFKAFDISRRLSFMNGFYGAATGISAHVFTLILLTYGAYLVLDGSLTPALLIAFNLFVPFVNDAVSRLSDLYTEFQTSMGASKRFFELIERESKIPIAKGNKLARAKGHVALQNLCFSYPARPDALVLKDLSLEFVPGTITALVGPSGSGKTTILAMLGRIYDPTSGAIYIDGFDVKSLDLTALHEHIGIVNQEPSLFSGTLYDNVAYANDKATKEDIINACKKAHAHEFITQFPLGYDTDLGDRGTQLSGGQKQRIAIARAILKNPSILLLDEATSELDVESEHLVQQALETLMTGKTVIIVAHRLSTVLSADVIAVIDDGKVVEKGSHEDLLEKKGTYFDFVQRQWQKGGNVPDLAKQQNVLTPEQEQAIKRRKMDRVKTLFALSPVNPEGEAGSSSPTTPWQRNEVKKKEFSSVVWQDRPGESSPEREKDQKKLVEKSIKKIRRSTRYHERS